MAFCANCIEDHVELFPALWDGKRVVLCAGCGGEPLLREEPQRISDEEQAAVPRPTVYGPGRAILEAMRRLGGSGTIAQVHAALRQAGGAPAYHKLQNTMHHLKRRGVLRNRFLGAGVSGGLYLYEIAEPAPGAA